MARTGLRTWPLRVKFWCFVTVGLVVARAAVVADVYWGAGASSEEGREWEGGED